jgi:hypothetical protein
MTTPSVTERLVPLEPVVRDTFVESDAMHAAGIARSASWPWPTRRVADA